jgi:tetratricopeptide (TPR) repeat protein
MRRGVVMWLLVLGISAPPLAFAQQPKKPADASKPAAESAQPQDLITRGQTLFEDQQYEESIQALSAALLRPSNTPAQKVEIYRLLALNYITLGRNEEADNAVRGLLVAQPDYQLPSGESPRFREFFASSREKWEAEGRPGLVAETPAERPVVLRHGSPSTTAAGQTIDLRGKLEDPDGRTGSVKLYFRAGSRGEFDSAFATIDEGSVHAQIPGASVKPPVMDYYFEVLDGGGAVIAARGDAQSPLRIAVPEKSSGWVLPVAIGGGILGAAAIVGGLALAGVFSDSSPSGSGRGISTVSISVGDASFRF